MLDARMQQAYLASFQYDDIDHEALPGDDDYTPRVGDKGRSRPLSPIHISPVIYISPLCAPRHSVTAPYTAASIPNQGYPAHRLAT